MSQLGYTMKFSSMSDLEIVRELGRRIQALRLRQNSTQQSLASSACLSRKAVSGIENGSSGTKLATMVAVMRELGVLDELDAFLPEPTISPIQVAKAESKRRQRASGSGKVSKDESEW